MRFCQNILSPFWESFFQNLNFSHFSCHIIWLACRGVTIFLLRQRSRSGGPLRYPNMFLKSTENVVDAFEKKQFQFKIRCFFRTSQLLFWAFFLIFWADTSFQRHLKYFLWTCRTCSGYLRGSLDVDLYFSKKIVTARHANQIICQEKWEKLRFWKNDSQNGDRIFWQNLMFWAESFFSNSSRKVFVSFAKTFKVSG